MATVVIAVVADVIVSAVVSKVVSRVVEEVAVGLGVDRKTAGLVGGIAGIVGGSYVYGAGSSALGLSKTGETLNAAAGASETAAATSEVAGMTEAATSNLGAGASLAKAPGTVNLTGSLGQSMGYVEPATTATLAASTGGAAAGASLIPQSLKESSASFAETAAKPLAAEAPISSVAPGAAESMAVQAPPGAAVAAPKSAGTAWYEKLWDKSGGELVGGMVKGATTELLKADAAEADYGRKRSDELADREHMEWKGDARFRGLTPGDFGSEYDPKYVSRQGLLTEGA